MTTSWRPQHTHGNLACLLGSSEWPLGMKGLGGTALSDPLLKTNHESENRSPQRFLGLRPNLRLLN